MRLNNLKIGKRLSLGFGVVLLLLIGVGLCGLWGARTLAMNANKAVDIDAKSMELAERIRTNTIILRRYEKDIFINLAAADKVSEYYGKWAEAKDRMLSRISDLEKIATGSKDKEVLTAIRSDLDSYCKGFEGVLGQIRKGEISTTQDANKAIGGYKEAIHRMEQSAWDYAAVGVKRMEATAHEIDKLENKIENTMLTLMTIAILLTVLLTWLVTRSITKPVNATLTMITDIAQGEGDLTKRLEYDGKDELGALCGMFNLFVDKLHNIINRVAQTTSQVAAAATQLNSTAEQMATGAEEVAAQAGTVATAGEEMAATSSEIAQNCQMAASGAMQASTSANSGATVVQNTVSVMTSIAQRVQASAQTVESLGSRSDQIGAIIGTIEDIADQTNLLALNAAIEAARAGEQGRGFAVVADEVRALAERTTKATREISEMIKAIQSETRSAVGTMDEGVQEVERGTAEAARSGSALQEILNQIQNVTMQVNQIATAAEEQTATTSEISNNMQQITDVVHQTAKGAQESASAASQLTMMAEELQRLVGQFKLAS